MAALGLVATVVTDEAKREKPVLTLPGRLVIKTDGKDVGELSGSTRAVAYSSDGKRLAAVFSRDGADLAKQPYLPRTTNDLPTAYFAIKLWDARDGKELRDQIDDFPVGTAAFSHDAKQLFTSGSAGFEAFCMAFSPDGKRLAVGTRNFADQRKAGGIRGEVRFWDLTSGKHVATWKAHGQYFKALAYSPDGKQLALGIHTYSKNEAPVKVCDAETGTELLSLPDQGEGSRQAQQLVFSPDARRLAVILSEQDKTAVKVWDATTGKLLRTLPVDDADCRVAFAPDGARLAVGDSRGVTVLEIRP
jgi:WD40 repeat protein